ncbi:hypothetical protein GDO78_009583 [Eleutherodactylus coqui]|uniref:Uncharacterized protein n=1 Tax=Eleutherodactylus coqui TaxID=57060 RepID=A0A8J6FA94_ELECQ|nr:hypothetical protein GDO78_009583 [Eleutherodactylus coqui]
MAVTSGEVGAGESQQTAAERTRITLQKYPSSASRPFSSTTTHYISVYKITSSFYLSKNCPAMQHDLVHVGVFVKRDTSACVQCWRHFAVQSNYQFSRLVQTPVGSRYIILHGNTGAINRARKLQDWW